MIEINYDEGCPYSIGEASKLIGWEARKLKYHLDKGTIPYCMIGKHKHVLGKTIKEIKSGFDFPMNNEQIKK
jgi:hypothetical protein